MTRRTLALLLLAAGAAPAWGPQGHELAARLAERLLTSRTRERVAAALRPGETIVSMADWADTIRGARPNTSSWHFVNVPISRPRWDLARDCPADDCVVARVRQFAREWRDPATPPRRRREALLFIVHLTADLHQPLHVADNGDRGGNNTPVSYFGKRTNLHQLWDSGILQRMGAPDALLASMAAELTPARAAEWARGDAESWAKESYQAAREVAYGRLPRLRKRKTIVLSAPYARFAEPVVRTQLEKAGARIAAILNQ